MQPEHLIARPHALLQPATGVEALDFLRPSVTAFDARDERLADAELGGDVLLHPAGGDGVQNSFVATVQFVHALPLAANGRGVARGCRGARPREMPGWAPPSNLSELLRDNLGLQITCDCGHSAAPDVAQLRADLARLGGWREELSELPRYLVCSNCGEREMTVETVKP